jgi:hypothetical protein
MIFKIGDKNVLETIDWGYSERDDKYFLRLNNMKLELESAITSFSSPITVTPVKKDWYVV